MLFNDITTVNADFDVVEHAYVGVTGSTISYFDTVPPADPQAFGEVYEGKGRLLVPGFYNTHTHLPMCLMRGYAEGLPLMDWLNGLIFPFEDLLTEEDQYWGTLLGVAEMLRYGTVGASDIYLCQRAAGRALLESGAKADFSQNVVSFDESGLRELPFYQMALECQKEFDGAGDGRLHTSFALHAEYSNTERVARELAAVAAEHGSAVQLHLSETKGEVEQCRERHEGRSPVRFLHDCGLFDVPATAAHCVWVDDDDIAILREKGVSVASCPKSNLKLASGVAPIAALLDAGVNVTIGTDSVASNNNLNMVEEMRFFNLLQKGVRHDPTLISPKQTLYAATRAGALAQQRADCGLIETGFKADLAVLDVSAPAMQPCHDMLNNLVYSSSGSDVVLTMVDGAVLYRDGAYPTLDIERIVYEVEASRRRILGDLAQG